MSDTANPAHEIIRAATDWEADLIVMGTRGRTGLERLLLGSVARKVLQHAPCSVSDRARAGAVGSSLGRIWPARVYQRVVTPRHGWPWRG